MSKQRPYQIIVGYDFSESAQIAIDRAIALSDAEPRNVLHVLTVLDSGSTFEDAEKARERIVDEMRARLKLMVPSNDIQFFVHVRLGKPAEEMLQLAEELGAHLVLVGSHGRTGLGRLVLGSVSERVVREAKCPVLVVRDRGYADVELVKIVKAPPDHAKDAYLPPHRYSYSNSMVERNDPNWPLN